MIAQVAVSDSVYAIDRPYSYRIPDGLMLRSGMRVLVPFGNGNRKKEAVVLAVSAGEEAKLKAVEQTLDEEPVLTAEQLRLANEALCQTAGIKTRLCLLENGTDAALIGEALMRAPDKVAMLRALQEAAS